MVGDMFWWKIDEIFEDLPNIFGIVDDILIVGYDSNDKDNDKTRPKESVCADYNATPIIKKNWNHFRYNELVDKVLTVNCWGVWATEIAHIIQKWVDIKTYMKKPKLSSKECNQGFYDKK